MPIALIIEIIDALVDLAPRIPAAIALGKSAIGIISSGTVSPEEEASIRAQLDRVKAFIDGASP